MLKLGVPIATEPPVSADVKQQKTAVKTEQKSEVAPTPKKTEKKELALYSDWGVVLKKIAELKKSLSVGFAGASVYTDGNDIFVIRMSGFFLDKLKSNQTDMAIVRGVIAEHEGKNPQQIKLVVENKDSGDKKNDSDLESLFG